MQCTCNKTKLVVSEATSKESCKIFWYQIMNNIVYTNLLYKDHYFIIRVGRKNYIRNNTIKPT